MRTFTPRWSDYPTDPTDHFVSGIYTIIRRHGQVRVSNELKKQGFMVSPSGVRSVWLRHELACFKDRLRALEERVAKDGLLLTEAQVQALEKKKLDRRGSRRD